MKPTIKLFALASVAALVSAPLAMAGKTADDATTVEPAVEPTVEVDPELVDEGEIIEGEVVDGGDGEVTITMVECEKEDGSGCHEGRDGEVSEGEVPIDWVKRDGSTDEELIYQTTMDGGAPTALLEKGNPEIVGEDDRAVRIEEKAGAAPLIQRQKKGPVALVKKGRVFLR
jgi:hypothetical protein